MIVLSPESRPAIGRVALLVPRWTDAREREPQGVPFRSFTLGGAFLAAGYEVVVFDQEHDLDRRDRFAEFAAELDDCIETFIWLNEMYPSNQCRNTERLAARLKRERPDLPVIAGGEFLTVCPPDFLDYETPVDFFLRGYGEAAGLRLIERLALRQPIDDVPGLVWRDRSGVLRHNPPLGEPDFEPEYLALYRRLDLSCYVQTGGVFGNDQPTLALATGRGCTKGCRFCAWSGHPARILPAEPTFELMAELRARYGVRQFHIGELDFFMSQARALQLARLVKERLPDVIWFALGSPIDLVKLSDADWDLLRDGGLRKVEMGSESGSPELLRHIGKRHAAEDIWTVSQKMIERGIVPMQNFLFGFPGETHADRRASLRMIDRLAELSIELHHFTYRYYQPVWGTGLGELSLAHDQARPRRLDAWLVDRERYVDESARTMPWLSAADEREVKELVNFVLPLATSRQVFPSRPRRALYELLRARARAKVRRGTCGLGFSRKLYERVLARPLDQTYVA